MVGSSSYMAKPGQENKKWYVIDAANKAMGRVAAAAARILCGKHKPEYTPHVDTGDYVIVINIDKVKMTGKKAMQSAWHYHSGHPGGYKSIPWGVAMEKKPTYLFEHVVKGMLPRNRLKYISKLKVYTGAAHPHAAQSPEVYNF